MDEQLAIKEFLAGRVFAVVGASRDRSKYGNKVLRCYLQNDRVAWPVHPREAEIEGIECSPDLASLPESVSGISVITPPSVTEDVVEQAARAGIGRIWMQPGAESPAAVERARELGLHVIHGGACLLVALGFRE
ncbi:MAG: putative CoA-binding protein [Chlamydiales bacterium]|jgi:predicted CoA-binding protein